jgi:hypothetical protein
VSAVPEAGHSLSAERLLELLNRWADGLLTYQAAVQFLAGAGVLRPGHPLIGVTWSGDQATWAYLDLITVPSADWAEAIAGMSGGERATWILARSLCRGELEEFWRLDPSRKRALLKAIMDNAS